MKQLAPYVKFPIQYETWKLQKKRCHFTEHKVSSGNFCPECGNELIDYTEEQKQVKWCEDLIGNENFTHTINGEEMFFFSNLVGDHEVDLGSDEVVSIDAKLIQKKIKLFKEKHKDDLLKLEEVLGMKLEVSFGYVNTSRDSY